MELVVVLPRVAADPDRAPLAPSTGSRCGLAVLARRLQGWPRLLSGSWRRWGDSPIDAVMRRVRLGRWRNRNAGPRVGGPDQPLV